MSTSVTLNKTTKDNIKRLVKTPEGVSEFFVWVQGVFNYVAEQQYDLAHKDDDEEDPICSECGRSRPKTSEERAKDAAKREAQEQLDYYSRELEHISEILAEFDPDWVKEAT